MLTSYVKIAWRNLWKHRLFSVINIVGLASGLMVCMVMLTHLKGAFDYDNFHPDRNRIYRVLTDVTDAGGNRTAYATSPMPLADVMPHEYGFVEKTARVVRVYGDFYNKQVRFDDLLAQAVDPAFFTLFRYPMAKGQAVQTPNTAVLTHETAIRFFGQENPIGQTIQHGQLGNLVVSGVLADKQPHSHLRFDLLVVTPLDGKPLFSQQLTDWRQYEAGYTYLLVNPKTYVQAVEKALTALSKRMNREPGHRRQSGATNFSFRAQPLTALSPSTEYLRHGTYEPDHIGLLIEMGVGLLTLLLAGFNYVNLTLARSTNRAREVGIRKVVGALRWQVMGQFMAESALLSVLALGLAYLMFLLISPMPAIQQFFIGGVAQDARLWLIFVVFTLFTGLVAGLIPARLLSGFEIVTVLRSATGLKTIRGISLRKALIVAQFTLTLIAVVFLFTMLRQQRYMVNADYGFRRDGVLTLPLHNVPYQRYGNALSQLPGVEGVSPISAMLGDHGGDFLPSVRTRQYAPDSSRAFLLAVDAQFVPAMNLSVVAGRNLPPSVADTLGRQVLINETAAYRFGFREARAAVGQTIWLTASDEVSVVGVVKDFRYTTLAWKIEPLILRYQPASFRYVNLAVAVGSEEKVLAAAKTIWPKFYPRQPFTGQWYTDYLEQRHSHTDDTDILLVLIGLALSIACLGLFGMVTYQTEIRTKEVGIRKVMGASVAQIVTLLSWDFVKLLLLAAAMALPLGYVISNFFLNNFAYHVSVGPETAVVCVALLLVVGGLTIGWRTRQAAQTDPVNSLRTE